MKLALKLPLSLAVAGATFTGISMAQDWYVSGSINLNTQSDTNFTQQLNNGMGGNTSSNNALAFDQGVGVNAEIGKKLTRIAPGLRGALEVSYTKAEVDTVTIPDLANPGQTVTTPGSGDYENIAVFANAYYDFDLGYAVKPYVGAGVGFTQAEVRYSTQGINVFDDDDTRFAYQAKAGASYEFRPGMEVFGEYTYRRSEDLEFGDNTVGKTSIENESQQAGIGLRLRF